MKTTTKPTYVLNTGGNCQLFVRITNRINKVGQSIITVWDNHTGQPPRNLSLTKYAQSFDIDGCKFYMSEFKPL